MGKSALLAAAAEMASADGTRVVHGSGVDYETDVSFAGLHQLVGPLSEDLRELPVGTRTTIEVALGIGSGPAPDRLAVMNAALELFRCAAARTPLLVFIDDMHWLDRATGSVIGFVGRRLCGSLMGLLGARRSRAGGYFERAGLPELDVGPLTEPDAMTLLTHQFAHLPTRVLREVAHEAQGNPLALLEFATAAGSPHGAYPQASSASATGGEVRSLAVTRMLNRAGKTAGLPHIHPHQLRHTLATQAINRGMSLEAIAAMLGHRSMDMTRRYAKIANRTVADEYFAVTDKVDALDGQPKQLPADAIGSKMARPRRDHHRLLGNGYCTRPAELDCAFESICENCTFFQTGIEFRPTLQAQHDHAAKHGQPQRADLFARLLNDLNNSEAS